MCAVPTVKPLSLEAVAHVWCLTSFNPSIRR